MRREYTFRENEALIFVADGSNNRVSKMIVTIIEFSNTFDGVFYLENPSLIKILIGLPVPTNPDELYYILYQNGFIYSRT